jgi:hypothetical protein
MAGTSLSETPRPTRMHRTLAARARGWGLGVGVPLSGEGGTGVSGDLQPPGGHLRRVRGVPEGGCAGVPLRLAKECSAKRTVKTAFPAEPTSSRRGKCLFFFF